MQTKLSRLPVYFAEVRLTRLRDHMQCYCSSTMSTLSIGEQNVEKTDMKQFQNDLLKY